MIASLLLSAAIQSTMAKDYDYLLKVLLVGDSDVGKHEIMDGLEECSSESPFCSGSGEFCLLRFAKATLINLVDEYRAPAALVDWWKATVVRW